MNIISIKKQVKLIYQIYLIGIVIRKRIKNYNLGKHLKIIGLISQLVLQIRIRIISIIRIINNLIINLIRNSTKSKQHSIIYHYKAVVQLIRKLMHLRTHNIPSNRYHHGTIPTITIINMTMKIVLHISLFIIPIHHHNIALNWIYEHRSLESNNF